MSGVKEIIQFLIARLFANFGIVEKGKIYRCAQKWRIYPLWLCLGLKTRINLATQESDLQDRFEKWLWDKLGVKYITFLTIGPGDHGFEEALKALKECEKPVLFGCEGGKDRGGAIAAVYKFEVLGRPLREIVKDWMAFRVPGESWLVFLFERLS